MKPAVMLIEACDFQRYPVGGHLTTARQFLTLYGNRLALVGVSTDDSPVGQWTRRTIDGVEYDFFSIGRMDPAQKKPLIPRRLDAYLRLRHHRKRILSLGVGAAWVLAPEVMLAIGKWGLRVAYKFCGVENPLTMPRYAIGKWLAGPFERQLFAALAEHSELITAAADAAAIEGLRQRSRGVLAHRQIVPTPTLVDERIFHLERDRDQQPGPLLVSCGRLNLVKGWDLVFDAFLQVRNARPSARLMFVGDGEDRPKLEAAIRSAGVGDAVQITGFLSPREVARILNSADLFLLGSHREGWPTALVEAEACGLPAVSTDVSGASSLIEEGRNGYLVRGRDPAAFADRIIDALRLEVPNATSLVIGSRYTLAGWQRDSANTWEPLR